MRTIQNSNCWCSNPVTPHSHVNAQRWYNQYVLGYGKSKEDSWYHLATLFYKLGITIIY